MLLSLAKHPACAQLLMGCHPHKDAWVHHTGKGGGALGVVLFLVVIGFLMDGRLIKRRPH